MSILVIDVGTSSIRAAVVRADGTLDAVHQQANLPDTPFPGLVEFDAAAMASLALDLARASLAEAGPVDAVGITNQRASTIVWDRATGEPVAPGLGWQDLRTVGTCLELQADGIRLMPNASATKLAAILDGAGRDRDLCFGTIDSWIVWHLTQGAVHVTDRSNAGVTDLVALDATEWSSRVLDRLDIPTSMLPTIVPSTGIVGAATALEGAPPVAWARRAPDGEGRPRSDGDPQPRQARSAVAVRRGGLAVSLIDRLAVLKGMAVAIVVCLPLALLADVVRDDHPDSSLLPLLFLATLLGFVAAGWVAGRAAGAAPFSNGAVAALAGYVVLALISVIVRVAGDEPVHPARIVGTALFAYAAGLLGGSFARQRT